jgi:hypothetical protein
MKSVARSQATTGGLCPDCQMPIGVGNTIWKYPTAGATTGPGNGPGIWVCSWCHTRRTVLRDQRFTCVACGGLVDAVVEVGGRPYCPDCYAAMSVKAGRLP